MAGLLYFRPGPLAKPTADDIKALGLAHAFERPPAPRNLVGPGPSGSPGVVFADPERVEQIGYYGPAKQTWWEVPALEGESQLWIGWYNNAPPTPADLARKKQLDGSRVTLGDGQDWVVPHIHQWIEADEVARCVLPRPVTRAADGKWVYGEVAPLYRALWETSQRFWLVLLDAFAKAAERGRVFYEFDGLEDFACTLLGINYVVGWQEVSALKLLGDDATAGRVGEASVDLPTFMDWLQKKKRGVRWGQFLAWARGIAPYYRPTVADYEAMARGWDREED